MASQGSNSRLAQMQMRFQQKQMEEREQRKIEMTGGGNKTITETSDDIKSLNSTMGAGKVRQLFDERRRGTGIDKSYPLKPIVTRALSNNTTTVTSTTKQSSSLTSQQRRQATSTSVFKQTTTTTANGRTLSSETAIINKKSKVLNGNAPICNKRNTSSAPDNTIPKEILSNNLDLELNNTLKKLPSIEKLSLDDNKNLNGHESGDRNNNNSSNTAKESSRSLNNANIKLKPVVRKKTAPVIEIKSPKKKSPEREEKTFSSSSTQLLSPVSTKSMPTSGASTPKTNAKSANPSSARMAAVVMTPRSTLSPQQAVHENMVMCRICNRHFNADRIEKHQAICEKTAARKRKIFDASKHRVKGTEAEQYVRRAAKSSLKAQSSKPTAPAGAAGGSDPSKKSNWRKKHEEFIQAIRAAKDVKAHLAKGGKLSDLPPPPPSDTSDYIQCPHCGRRFNQAAAARHIPKCATMQHNKPKPNAPAKRGGTSTGLRR